MRLTTPMLLAIFAAIAVVTKISLDAMFPFRPRLSWKLLPNTTAIFMRLGSSLLAANDQAGAAAAYRRAVQLNPLLRFGAVQLAKLGG